MREAEGYVRVSRRETSNDGVGVDVQREAIAAYAQMARIKLVRLVEDLGVSGGTAIESRRGGADLIHSVTEHQRVLIALRQDRLFRSSHDAINTMDKLLAAGVETVLIRDGLDLSTRDGRMIFTIKAAVAQNEREGIRERTQDAMNLKKSRGERVSRHAPYGWRFVPTDRTGKGGKPVLVLERHPGELSVVDKMLELNQAGYAYRRIADWLNKENIQPRHGKRWEHTSVRKIIAAHRRLTSSRIDPNGKSTINER